MEKAETAKDPADGPNKKQRITTATGASSSTTPPMPQVSEERKSKFAVLPVDTELEELNRELAKRSSDEFRNSMSPGEDEETSEREKKRRMIGCVEGVDIREINLGRGVNDCIEERIWDRILIQTVDSGMGSSSS